MRITLRKIESTMLVLIVLLLCSFKSFSQNLKPVEQSPDPKFEFHQFYLEEPAIKIIDIKYDKDCTPVNGKLSEDGKRVIVKDYTEHSRIYFKYLKADGSVQEITKSPCFIDPVINVL